MSSLPQLDLILNINMVFELIKKKLKKNLRPMTKKKKGKSQDDEKRT